LSNGDCRMAIVEWRLSNGDCRMPIVECRSVMFGTVGAVG
jgi:hypothetical protein